VKVCSPLFVVRVRVTYIAVCSVSSKFVKVGPTVSLLAKKHTVRIVVRLLVRVATSSTPSGTRYHEERA
jgi:hypothetical protein